MTTRLPYLRITGPGGIDVGQQLGRDLIGVQVTDFAEGQSDRAIIRIRRAKPWRAAPPPRTPFEIAIGWRREDAVIAGTYEFTQVLISGDPEAGQELGWVCLAADYNERLKQVDSRHFDEEAGFRTYGDVLTAIATDAGLSAAIDPAIGSIPLAGGYLLRWKQSAIGFATDIAEDLGAIIKPQGGALTVRRRGSFQTPSGAQLATVTIPFDPNCGFQVDITPRYGFSEVTATSFDQRSGRPLDVLKQLGRGAARFALPHVVGSEQLAATTSAAAAQRLQAEQASGIFVSAGLPEAVAGAPVQPDGFGPDIDNLSWEAVTVVHDVEPERGWFTTTEVREAWI